MTTPTECLTTYVTAVRFLICVYVAVTRQITELSERLATVLALMLAVPADVAVTLLHVFVQMSLSQTPEVAVNTADHRAT